MFKINAEKAAAIENAKRLQALPQELEAIFSQLPVEVRAQFFEKKAAIKLAFEQGDTLAALAIIQAVEVPTELQEAKDAMLNLFGVS